MIYLDHNATAPLLPEVRDLLARLHTEPRGNASSLHGAGQRARALADHARGEVAALIGATDPRDLIFTSGGTEGDVWALRGSFDQIGERCRDELVVSAVEHPAVLQAAAALEARGVSVRRIPVDARGRLQFPELGPRTRLVSVMAANNEVGNIYDIEAVVQKAHDVGALVHTDAVQAAGRVPLDVDAWGVDLCTISAHKIGGPQGVGALYIRPGTHLAPLLPGGGQERGLRSGTLNVAGIAGFGLAARLALERLDARVLRMRGLRDRLESAVCEALDGVRIHGDLDRSHAGHATDGRLPNTSNFSFPGISGEALVFELDQAGIAVSTGSACSSGSGKASHVLVAMGLPKEEVAGALRISLGPSTTGDEIDRAVAALVRAVVRLRALSPSGPGSGVASSRSPSEHST